jgi:hypothetical protein
MDNLHIAKTKYTLEVNFDKDSGILQMQGSSYPENAFDFFSPIIEWLKKFTFDSNKPIVMNMRLNYLNTSSTKCILDIFEILNTYMLGGNQVKLNWYYDNDDMDMMETGEELIEDFDIPFDLIPV